LIETVTLDLWNTLFVEKDYSRWRLDYLEENLREHGLDRSRDEIRGAYTSASDHAHRVWEVESYRHLPIEERLDHILGKLRVDLPGDARSQIIGNFVEAIWRDLPPLKEGVMETLEALEPRYRMGIVSDSGITPAHVTREVLRDRGILDFFESTVFSDEVGICKPHEAMFMAALRELDTEPSEAVHVGDLLRTDVAGAKAMGMKAVWLKAKDVPRKGRWAPDHEITALPQLIDVLGEINS
jgi:putative hydrolase of the HAD superfamily